MPCGCWSTSPSLVAFWDEGSRRLTLQPWNRINIAQCHRLKVPRFKSTFDLYNPIGSQAYPLARTPIIPQDVADTEGRTFEAALHFNILGVKAKFLRAVSKQHRVLYVGPSSSIQEKV